MFRIQVNGSSSEPFKVSVGVHQGSVLSPFLFINVMEALSGAFRVSCPWELLYADDLVILSDSLKNKLAAWKTSLESHGFTCKHIVPRCKCQQNQNSRLQCRTYQNCSKESKIHLWCMYFWCWC